MCTVALCRATRRTKRLRTYLGLAEESGGSICLDFVTVIQRKADGSG